MDIEERRHTLDTVMEQRGDWPADSPWIRRAVTALHRDQFAPDTLWRWDGHRWGGVDRTADPDSWAAEVYGGPDQAAVTEVSGDLPASSMSCQAVVVDMLDSLVLEPGHRVLELGTGTGWNAALLAYRAGPGQVVSVEVDQRLALAAQRRLDAPTLAVEVRVGDGAAGWPGGALYDRLISTYAVECIPWAWVEQVKPGGRIVTPWGRLGHVALTVAADARSASGLVQGLAQFMPARDALGPGRGFADVRGTGAPDVERPFDRNPDVLRADWNLRFAVRAILPDVQIATGTDDDGTSAWLHDGAASWAVLSALPGGRTVAHQGGPRHLADEVGRAWDWWDADGQPPVYEWGLTVGPERQYVWCHDAEDGPRWTLSPSVGLVS